MEGRVSIVHNGTINNTPELKKELESKGVIFKSETDTEVYAPIIYNARNIYPFVASFVFLTSYLFFKHTFITY